MASGETSDDAMMIVASLVSRVEALVVASMLEAAGVLVHVGGSGHASVSVNSLALGGHRLWIPARQHRVASDILREVLGEEEWGFSFGLQRAVLRFWAFMTGLAALVMMPAWLAGFIPAWYLAIAPFAALPYPVNPQGRGDYYLHE